MCPAFGVYPIADALDPGDEISSTLEGRHVTVLESDLIHPTHVGGIVDKGDPVVFGTTGLQAVGVALGGDANTVAGDLIAIDTEGIWNLDVDPTDDAGNSNVAGGDLLYINTTNAVISKISNQATQIPFGIAYGIITAPGVEAIAVKVHFDPSLDNAKRTYITVATGTYVYGKHHTSIFAGGESTGLEYFDQQVSGAQTGGIYGFGTWLELAGGGTPYVSIAALTVAHEIGIYDAGATLTLARVVMQQIQGILASAPASLHIWRVNIAAAGGAITALIAAANPTSVGFVAGVGVASAKNGNIPIADIVGTGVVWVRTYAAAN